MEGRQENKKLLDALNALSADAEGVQALFPKIQLLKNFLGPNLAAVYPTEATRKKAEVLCADLCPGPPTQITIDGLPTLTKIIQAARCKLVLAENLKKIQEIDDHKDITKKSLEYLDRFTIGAQDENTIYNNFLEKNLLNANNDSRSCFDNIIEAVRQKQETIRGNTEQRSLDKIKNLQTVIKEKVYKLQEVHNKIDAQILKITQTEDDIKNKRNEIETSLVIAKADLLTHSQSEKEGIKKSIDNHTEQLKLLNSTALKVHPIKTRLEHRQKQAQTTLKNKFFKMYKKISATDDIDFEAAIRDRLQAVQDLEGLNLDDKQKIYYKIEGNICTCKILNTIDDLTYYEDIELDADLDVVDQPHFIFQELVNRHHIIPKKYKPFKLGDPNAGIVADEKAVEILADELEDLEQDVARCEKEIHLADLTAANPAKQLHTKSLANTFIDVRSLSDINSSKTLLFRDTIIDAKTLQPKNNDPRTKYGLEGEVITRGIMLEPGEVARSVYNNSQQTKEIIIDTKFVQSKRTPEHSIAKTELIWKGTLTPQEKQASALLYARKLLLQYTEGDPQSKIIIQAGRNQKPAEAKEQANMVYAAILMLTSEETAGKNCIKLPSEKLSINVKGVGPDLFGTWPWKRKQDFIHRHFQDESRRKEMGKQVTDEYRALRNSINKHNKQATISEDAVDDIHHAPLLTKRI